jgi:hypothetical protein
MIPAIRAVVNGIVYLTVPDITTAMTVYTKIVVVEDTVEGGSYGTETGTATLVAEQTGYAVFDEDGSSSVYYKAKLSNADGSTVSELSTARQGETQAAYCLAQDVRQELASGSGQAEVNQKHDHSLWEMCIECSRLIDRFKDVEDDAYLASGSELRYFDGTGDGSLWLEDMPATSIATVEVEETDGTWTEWASTDYYEWPYNESYIRRLDVNVKSDGNKSAWTSGRKRVRLTGVWGIATSVPGMVARACKVQVASWYKKAMGGWSGTGGMEPMGMLTYPRELDPEVKGILRLAKPHKVVM